MFRRRTTLWLIILLTLVSVFINLPELPKLPGNFRVNFGGREQVLDWLAPRNLVGHFPIKLGLDLQGGTQLVLQTQMDKIPEAERDNALESARLVIERRVNLYGVSESLVQSSKTSTDRRILVELPGVKDLSTAVNLVGKTAQLEFREIPEGTASAQIQDFRSTGLTGADLARAQVVFGQSSGGASGPQVQIDFNGQGAQKFAEITKRNISKPLAIFLDEIPIQAPIVQDQIIGGSAVISGGFTTEQAKSLAVQLNAGALPVPIKILEQRSIAATLGAESVAKSLTAAGIGLLTVMIFMVAYYSWYGLIADLALILYTLVVLAIFRTGLGLIPPVTLTLAGIAGFILSIGMAVDANILTFERMKEELRTGKSSRQSLEDGFKRAWSAIRDSNISSLITATILYIFGTSVVRGFALTLSIGVLVSMFSAVVVTRTLMRLVVR